MCAEKAVKSARFGTKNKSWWTDFRPFFAVTWPARHSGGGLADFAQEKWTSRQTGEASLTARASIAVNSNPQTIQSCPDPGSQPRLASTTTPPTRSLRLPRRLHRGHVSCSEPDACHIAQEHSTVVSAAVACDPGPRNLVLCDTSKTSPPVHLIISTKTKTSSYEPSRYTGWLHPSFVRQEWCIIGLSSFPIALIRYFPSRPRRSLQNHEHADKTSSDLDRTFQGSVGE